MDKFLLFAEDYTEFLGKKEIGDRRSHSFRIFKYK